MTLTGSRLYYALGSRHAQFARLGQWNARRDAPSAALLLEAAISIITMLVLVAMYGPNDDIFNRLVAFTSPVYWLFIAAAVAAIIVLRVREPLTDRPIRVPLYPLLPLAVIAGCCFLVDAGVRYAWSQRSWEAVWPLAMIVVGAVLAWTEGNPVADSTASTTSGERR
jgi:amino acid transporter